MVWLRIGRVMMRLRKVGVMEMIRSVVIMKVYLIMGSGEVMMVCMLVIMVVMKFWFCFINNGNEIMVSENRIRDRIVLIIWLIVRNIRFLGVEIIFVRNFWNEVKEWKLRNRVRRSWIWYIYMIWMKRMIKVIYDSFLFFCVYMVFRIVFYDRFLLDCRCWLIL